MPSHDPRSHGAIGDGRANDTRAVQAAIDACAAAGGGRVLVPAGGTFRIGTIALRDHVELHLENGALLVASEDPADYRELAIAGEYGGNRGAFVIYAEGCRNVAITGLGTIDGRGSAFMAGPWHGVSERGQAWIMKPQEFRPRLCGLFRCRDVTVRDVTLRDAAQWTLHLTGCDGVVIDGVRIRNRLDVPNCDGIDPDHCRNVTISNCHIEAGDDGIVIKNTRPFADCGPTENIVVQNCTIISTSAAVKIGSESVDAFRGILVQNCAISRSSRGLAIQLRDEGAVEDVLFANCRVETRRFHHAWWGNAEPIYVTARPRNERIRVGTIRGVRFSGIRCRGEGGIFVAGTADAPVRDLVFDDVDLRIAPGSRWPGGWRDYRPCQGQEHGGRDPGEEAGIHLEHVAGVRLAQVRVQRDGALPWLGPALRQECATDVDASGFRGW